MVVFTVMPAWAEGDEHDLEKWDRMAREASAKYAAGEITAAMVDWQRLAKEAESFGDEDVRQTLVLHNLGALHVELGRPLEALQYLEAAARRMLRGAHKGLKEEKTLNYLAMAYVETGNYSKAERALGTVREKARARGERSSASLTMADLLESRIQVGRGRRKEAERTVRGALLRLKTGGQEALDQELSLLNQLGNILSLDLRWEEAEQAYRRAAEVLGEELGERHPSTAKARLNLALALIRSGRAEEAESMTAEAQQALAETLGAGHWTVGVAMQRRAAALRELQRGKEAKELDKRAGRIAEEYQKRNQIGSTVDMRALTFRENQ